MKRILGFILVLALALTGLVGCGEPVGEGACEYFGTRDTTGRDIKYVMMSFSGYGSIILLLDATTAPITVENFVNLVEDGFYRGRTMHRIIKNFMIQGGALNPREEELTPIIGEFAENGHPNDIQHKKGVISMARTSFPNSATSQFFICNADSNGLDGKYAAFGYVIAGLSVIDEITKETVRYTVGDIVVNEDNRAKISSAKVISEEEALSYVLNDN